jgi:hypothetical protein
VRIIYADKGGSIDSGIRWISYFILPFNGKKVIENIFSLCLNVEQFFHVEKTDKKNSGCICESPTRVRDCQN